MNTYLFSDLFVFVFCSFSVWRSIDQYRILLYTWKWKEWKERKPMNAYKRANEYEHGYIYAHSFRTRE